VNGGTAIASERRLIDEAVGGCADSLGRVLDRYEARLRGFVHSSVRNFADAEDCLQEIRLRVTRAIPRFRTGAPFAPWLFSIAANAVRNAHSRTRRSPSLVEDPADSSADAVARLIREEEVGKAKQAVATLPDRYREVLLYRIQQGLSHREVALALGVSEPAARVLFCRALKSLRRTVGGRHDPS